MFRVSHSTPISSRSSIGALALLILVTTFLSYSGSPTVEAGTTEVICDNKSSCFSKYESSGAWGYVQPGTGDSSSAYSQHAYWTLNGQNSALDWGKWQPDLPQTGTYDIHIWYPHFPGYYPETGSAHYQVHHTEGDQYVTWNQATGYGRWNKIATVQCNAGKSCYVKLTDETHESTGTRRVWFDAIKFVLVETADPGDITMPDGKITAPLDGQTINSATLTFSAEAWDNDGGSGVARVEFKIFSNGAWRHVGTEYKAPYYIRWTPPTDLGAQQLQFAIHVIDNAGNRRIDPGGIRKINFKPSQAPDNGFKLPYPGGTGYFCTQGNHSSFSHNGQYAYAFDFGMPRGHNVVTARNGRVVAVKGNSNLGGCSSWYKPYANYVRIRHTDGTDTLYVHLDSVSVSHEQSVQRGQVIGRSGQTGYTCSRGGGPGPHLHFDRRNAGGSWTIATRFLDVSGSVPHAGGWYKSGNYRGQAVALVQTIEQPALQEGDAVGPTGDVQFHLTGETPYMLWLMAEDDMTLLDNLEMRLAASEAELEQSTWQPFAGETTWDDTTVWVQFRDAAGNVSDSYADTLDPVATSPVTAAFAVESTVCASTELSIENQSEPFCEQCRWEWSLGNGTTSIAPDPAPVSYPTGNYTVTLTVSGASNVSSATRQVTVLPVPDASFELTRDGDTVTVTADATDATAWEWDFGDGTTASGKTATHTYAADALAEELPAIRLTVKGSNSCSGEAIVQLAPETQQNVYLPMIMQ
jgi:murein DD-endopeptidase MepM/ murein hydrolase activator NlpD